MSSTFNPPSEMLPSNVICGPGELLQSEKPTAACTCTGIVKVLATCFCACAGKAYARPTDIAISTLLFIPMDLFFGLFLLQDVFPTDPCLQPLVLALHSSAAAAAASLDAASSAANGGRVRCPLAGFLPTIDVSFPSSLSAGAVCSLYEHYSFPSFQQLRAFGHAV